MYFGSTIVINFNTVQLDTDDINKFGSGVVNGEVFCTDRRIM